MAERTKRASWVKELLAGLAAVSGVGYVAASYTVSRWLTRRSRGRSPLTPTALGLPWQPLECRTTDGLRLRGWVVNPDGHAGTVALFHGLRQHRGQTLQRSAMLASAGYRCVAFDHRAHGESDGRRTSFGYHERRDVAAVLELVRRRWPQQPRMALGISMGAAALCFAAPHVRDLDAVILESLYLDLGSTFRSRLGDRFPSWFRRFTRGVVWMTERRLGTRLEQVCPAEWIGRLAPTPVLLLTGQGDPHAGPADAERLFQRCQSPRELSIIPGADHLNLFEAGGELYRAVVLEFLRRQLTPACRVA